MKYVLAIIALLLLYAWLSSAQAQEAPKDAFPKNGVTVSEPFYPFPPEDKIKVRDLQYESDQLEIQNAKLQLQIDQNKTRQNQLMDQEKLVAFQFASKRQINLDLYELDPVQIRFIKKQSPKK